nr:MAG TPA: hypothetical protein [Caudoviricetes sp.]
MWERLILVNYISFPYLLTLFPPVFILYFIE